MGNVYAVKEIEGVFHVYLGRDLFAKAYTTDAINAIVAGIYMVESTRTDGYDVTYTPRTGEPVILASDWIEIPRKIK